MNLRMSIYYSSLGVATYAYRDGMLQTLTQNNSLVLKLGVYI